MAVGAEFQEAEMLLARGSDVWHEDCSEEVTASPGVYGCTTLRGNSWEGCGSTGPDEVDLLLSEEAPSGRSGT